MSIELSAIWRHPIKSIGTEKIDCVTLEKNKTMPLDRAWALTHDKTKFNFQNPSWVPCSSFIRVSTAPKLMAVKAKIDEVNSEVILSHPSKNSLRVPINSSNFSESIMSWVSELCPNDGPQSLKIVKIPERGMTDTDYASISLLSINSIQNLSKLAGSQLDMRRFRGNLWIKNLDPYEELNWVGKKLTIGNAELEVIEPIERCNATKTNPSNGEKDVDTLKLLRDNFQHQNFGVYCKVVSSGRVKLKDRVSLA